MVKQKKDWWTLKRKRRLLKFAKSLTLTQISKKMHKPIQEIEAKLLKLDPEMRRIPRDKYRERGVTITVYSSAHAYGSQDQHMVRPTYHDGALDCHA